jgi:hypothetical protein
MKISSDLITNVQKNRNYDLYESLAKEKIKQNLKVKQ